VYLVTVRLENHSNFEPVFLAPDRKDAVRFACQAADQPGVAVVHLVEFRAGRPHQTETIYDAPALAVPITNGRNA
jgi:hypothetical protein